MSTDYELDLILDEYTPRALRVRMNGSNIDDIERVRKAVENAFYNRSNISEENSDELRADS